MSLMANLQRDPKQKREAWKESDFLPRTREEIRAERDQKNAIQIEMFRRYLEARANQ